MTLRLSILLLSLVTANAASVYYVATTGSDANPGTIGSPWLNIRYGVLNMGPSDTLNIRTGTYSDDGSWQIEEFQSGTSIGSPTTIQAYNGETVTYHPTAVAGTGHAMLLNNKSNIVLNGFAINADNMAYDGIKLTGTSKYVTITNVTVRDCKSGHGILLTSDNDTDETHHTITHCRIQNNGWAPLNSTPLHQLYTQTSSNLVENCYFQGTNNAYGGGYGIHHYSNGGYGSIYRNNQFTNCPAGSLGIVGGAAHDIQIYNNAAWNGGGYGISVKNASNMFVLNNTCVSNLSGILVETSTNVWVVNNITTGGTLANPGGIYINNNSTGIAVSNNLAYANSYSDYRVVSTTATTNANRFGVTDIGGVLVTNSLSFDAKFASLVTPDFHLTAGSDAIGTGATETLFSTDAAGTARTVPWDMGIYKYTASGVSTPRMTISGNVTLGGKLTIQ